MPLAQYCCRARRQPTVTLLWDATNAFCSVDLDVLDARVRATTDADNAALWDQRHHAAMTSVQDVEENVAGLAPKAGVIQGETRGRPRFMA